ncbi:hypothetical protein [Alicyclobacillus acidoterrestris]|uniref:Uncharacterized protein n=1 Tax=Alicyclobacillus acidoterrestris (strain ATCC 49025 / DSM 3922 / CIP 106132 / NCIMB 13137 / GD3B) TaxID=1356854 RepID=T0D813_ALIAG|nr:hypothetical protein [Alicyclobacillus acidoterrestris]EPZ47637.1 hypothetical protein N007_05105 [Alicyclobacillus acidoterrestris ATCC 49025]UNO48043.1 hypothetical protein K1I37_15325 [Alicyclobacillus acidoterrestris]
MSKSQFIYRYGSPAIVTRNDNTTYRTRILYERSVSPNGTFSDTFMFGMDLVRTATFQPCTDIDLGYLVEMTDTGETLFVTATQVQRVLGEPISISAELVRLHFPNAIQLLPSQADENVERDKFGRPLSTIPPTQVNVIITKADLNIVADVGGGKPVEQLEFYCHTGDVNENDEIQWNGHTYRVIMTWPFAFAATARISHCKAQREVDA